MGAPGDISHPGNTAWNKLDHLEKQSCPGKRKEKDSLLGWDITRNPQVVALA
jgi:hypothetical protein